MASDHQLAGHAWHKPKPDLSIVITRHDAKHGVGRLLQWGGRWRQEFADSDFDGVASVSINLVAVDAHGAGQR